MNRIIAVILGAGLGSRTGLDTPKQFLKVAGRMVIEHTVQAFQEHPSIDEIAIVVDARYFDLVQEVVLRNRWNKVRKILVGGHQRYESSLSAVKAYAHEPQSRLVFHDAVRPLVSGRIIDDVIAALGCWEAVDTAISTADTIIKVNESGIVSNIPNRSLLRRGQTPQAFKVEVILRAYESALSDQDFSTTDDCGVVAKYLPDVPIKVVDGEETNMKLTYLKDLFLLDRLFQLRTRTFAGSDTFDGLEGKVAVVFGGNSGIGQEIVKMCSAKGASAYPFSRSLNGVDIGNRANVRDALQNVHATKGKIDFVVNCAALLSRQPLVNMKEQDVADIVNTNCIGMVNTSICSFDYLRETAGQLLHFTSSSYTRGRAFYSIYSSTKAGVVNFVQALAQEWEPFSIRVNCINPERTRTPLRQKHFGQEPENTLLKPETVAAAAIQTLLGSFTGQVVDVKALASGPD